MVGYLCTIGLPIWL